jgi:alpha-beta hydrolase superfamily lysophospholipase
VGEKLRREVFFFSSGGVELYGSTYAPASPEPPPLGVVICNSWGYEANLAGAFVHPFSVKAARAGAVVVNFHYPGFGDSQGNADETTIDLMAGAAVDALREASRRRPNTRWILAGLMLGSSIAALAADRGGAAERLLLVQPVLRPGGYFARLERASKRSLGKPAPDPALGFAYGYRLARPMLDSAPRADRTVEAALADFDGGGTVVRCEKPTIVEGVPERFEQVRAPGAWRFGTRNHSPLVQASAAWLAGRLEAEA